jgi:hypothetical protein
MPAQILFEVRAAIFGAPPARVVRPETYRASKDAGMFSSKSAIHYFVEEFYSEQTDFTKPANGWGSSAYR